MPSVGNNCALTVSTPNVSPNIGLKWYSSEFPCVTTGVTSKAKIVTKSFGSRNIGFVGDKIRQGARSTRDPGLKGELRKGGDKIQFALEHEGCRRNL